MNHTRYLDSTPYVTRDGSVIRELMHPSCNGSRNQSLAEATVATGQKTRLHKHRSSEELYFITSGQGHMTLGDEQFDVRVGDTVCIAPGTPHCIENTGTDDLVILCSCAPAYRHDDTELLSE
jgi:mannose-6-phosphate isomerase-like protein (cupin superfamily)